MFADRQDDIQVRDSEGRLGCSPFPRLGFFLCWRDDSWAPPKEPGELHIDQLINKWVQPVQVRI